MHASDYAYLRAKTSLYYSIIVYGHDMLLFQELTLCTLISPHFVFATSPPVRRDFARRLSTLEYAGFFCWARLAGRHDSLFASRSCLSYIHHTRSVISTGEPERKYSLS